MYEHTQYRHLTDAEFLSVAEAAQDPLTSTDVQTELLNRFTKLVGSSESLETAADRISEQGFDVTEEAGLQSLIDVLQTCRDFDADEPAALRQKLQRAHDFYDIADEAGDLLQRLAELAAKTL